MKCPCCGEDVDHAQHPGLVINRKAYLRSQIVTMEEQYERGKRHVPATLNAQAQWVNAQLNLGKVIIAFKRELAAFEAIR